MRYVLHFVKPGNRIGEERTREYPNAPMHAGPVRLDETALHKPLSLELTKRQGLWASISPIIDLRCALLKIAFRSEQRQQLDRTGRGWLAELDPPAASREIATNSLAAIDDLTLLIERLDGELRHYAKADPRPNADHAPGVGQFTALVIVAEIGDISRFLSARKLATSAGLTMTLRSSDLKIRHRHISTQGPAWVRWVLNQAAQTAKRSPDSVATDTAIAKRRRKKTVTVAIARKLPMRVWHLLAVRGGPGKPVAAGGRRAGRCRRGHASRPASRPG